MDSWNTLHLPSMRLFNLENGTSLDAAISGFPGTPVLNCLASPSGQFTFNFSES